MVRKTVHRTENNDSAIVALNARSEVTNTA